MIKLQTKLVQNKKTIYITIFIIAAIALLILILKSTLLSGHEKALEQLPTPTSKRPIQTQIPGKDFVAGHVIVKLKQGTAQHILDQKLKTLNARITDKIPAINTSVLVVPMGREKEIVDELTRSGYVENAELDLIYKLHSTPNDPGFGQEWHLPKIQAPQAWDIATGKNVKIGIVDQGFDTSHPDLAPKIAATRNVILAFHGTHTSGIAAAATNNGKGISGTCPDCQLLLASSGLTTFTLSQNIIWVSDQGAKVISMSWGTYENSLTLKNALDYAWNKGIVLITSAGNDSSNYLPYPAAYTNVVSVASTNQNDTMSSFSNFGSTVTIAAPGSNILSTMPNSSYGLLSGTSQAAPMTAGVAGLIWSSSYGTSRDAVIKRLCDSADKIAGTGVYWKCGRLNAFAAVAGSNVLNSPTPTQPQPTNTPPSTPTIPNQYCLGSCPTAPVTPVATQVPSPTPALSPNPSINPTYTPTTTPTTTRIPIPTNLNNKGIIEILLEILKKIIEFILNILCVLFRNCNPSIIPPPTPTPTPTLTPSLSAAPSPTVSITPPVGLNPPANMTSAGTGGGGAYGSTRTVGNVSYNVIAPAGNTKLPLLIVFSGVEGASQMTSNILTLQSSVGLTGWVVAVIDGAVYNGNGQAGANVLEDLRRLYDIDNDRMFLMGESAGTTAALQLGFQLRQSYFAGVYFNDINATSTPAQNAAALGFHPYGGVGPGGHFDQANSVVNAMTAAGYRTQGQPYSGPGSAIHGDPTQAEAAFKWFPGKSRM